MPKNKVNNNIQLKSGGGLANDANGLRVSNSLENTFSSLTVAENVAANNAVYVATGTLQLSLMSTGVTEGVSFDSYLLKRFGQTFTTGPNTVSLSSITFGVNESWGGNAFGGNIYIYATAAGLPTGAALATVAWGKAGGEAITATANFSLALSPNTQYAFLVQADTDSSSSGGTRQTSASRTTASYSGGSWIQTLDNGVTYTANTAYEYGSVNIVTIEGAPGSIFKTTAVVNNERANNFIGFVSAAKNAGETAEIITAGVMTGFSGLTPGSIYYLSDTAGAISTSAGSSSKKVGRAISATKLLIYQSIA